MNDTVLKRRWFRWSLLTLLVMVAVGGVFAAWYVQPAEFSFEIVGDLPPSEVRKICAEVARLHHEPIHKIALTPAGDVEVTSWRDRPDANGTILGLARRNGKWKVHSVTHVQLVEGKSRWEPPADLTPLRQIPPR